MNKIMMTLAAVMTMSFAACAQNKGGKNMETENKPLVVYFLRQEQQPRLPG